MGPDDGGRWSGPLVCGYLMVSLKEARACSFFSPVGRSAEEGGAQFRCGRRRRHVAPAASFDVAEVGDQSTCTWRLPARPSRAGLRGKCAKSPSGFGQAQPRVQVRASYFGPGSDLDGPPDSFSMYKEKKDK